MKSGSTSCEAISDKRKRLWERNKELYERHVFHGRPKGFISCFHDYFVCGVEDKQITPYDKLHFDTAVSPEERRRKWWELTSHPHLSTAAWASSLVNGWAYCHGAHSIFTTEDGILGGEELEIFSATIPTSYDHAVCQAELRDLPPRRTQIAPIEAMSIFLDGCMLGPSPFFTATECNPYHPVQAFFDFWSQTLPYFDPLQNEETMGDLTWNKLVLSSEPSHRVWELQLFRLMVAVRYFVDPRSPQGSDTSIKRLRDKLWQLFETGTKNRFIDELWKGTEVLTVTSPLERPFFLPTMVSYSSTFQAKKMRLIFDAFKQLGFVSGAFVPEKIDLVDMGPRLLRNDALNIGYDYPKPARGEDIDLYGPSGIVAPAFLYSFSVGSAMTFYRDVNWNLIVSMYAPIWLDSQRQAGVTPDLYLEYQVYNRERVYYVDEPGYDSDVLLFRGALSEELLVRQVYRLVWEKHGIQLSDRAFGAGHKHGELRQTGLFWTIEPWGISPLTYNSPPYPEPSALGGAENEMRLAAFRRDVMREHA